MEFLCKVNFLSILRKSSFFSGIVIVILKFSNVTTDILSLIDEAYADKIKGNIFGEVSIGQDLNPDDISLDITLKNGEVANQSFDDFYISLILRNQYH